MTQLGEPGGLFCQKNCFEFLNFDASRILQFLAEKNETLKSSSSLNTYRSALAFLADVPLGEDPLIQRFFRGLSVLKPARPRYECTWNPKSVLTILDKWPSNDQLSLEHLTRKLSTLMALTTAQRMQTLSKIDINNISSQNDITYITIPDRIKTTKSGKPNPLIELPRFQEQRNLCVVSTLDVYIQKTEALRTSSKLFITTKKPHGPATTQTISNWVKKTLGECEIDTTLFKSHSTRDAATSLAAFEGIN